MKKSIPKPTDTAIGRQAKKGVVKVRTVYDDIGRKHINLLAAGIAYFGVLAFFPLVVAIVALGSIFSQADSVQDATNALMSVLPDNMSDMLADQLQNAQDQHTGSVIVVVVGVTLSIIGISGAVGNIMGALNAMYGLPERRSFWRRRLVSLGITIGLVTSMLVMTSLLFTTKSVLEAVGASASFMAALAYARWIILIVMMMVGLSVLYRIGPSHPKGVKAPWFSWGAVISTAVWLIASIIFFWYVDNIVHLSQSYSLFAGIIGLMLWLNVSSYVILLGAEINHRIDQARS